MKATRIGADLIRKGVFRVPEESGYNQGNLQKGLCSSPH
jgi:hypothetical protein